MNQRIVRQSPFSQTEKHEISSPQAAIVRKNLLKILSGGYRFEPHRLLTWLLESVLRELGCPQFTNLPPQEVQQTITEASALYYDYIKASEPFLDLLGPIYMDLASRGHQSALGQFFTPYPIARMMASMSLSKPEPQEKRMITACDPASGSGVMMLALAREVLGVYGSEALARHSFTCVDLDRICALMSATQLLANAAVHGITLGEIVVHCGNSLLMGDMELIAHFVIPDARVAPADHPARLAAIREAAESSLFPWFQQAG